MTTETETFHPEHRFEDFDIHPKLKENIAKKGYVHPTPIQDGAIPHILEGRDVIGIASTGTGKTAAFLLPLITKVFGDRKKEFVLILAPTRELALQIKEEFDIFAAGSGLLTALLIGGAHMDKQISDLRRGPNFIIGTPGRIKDLVERQYLNLAPCNNIVLDEVDRMLDMGFINDIRHILSLIQEKRQSLFFSATMDKEIRKLADQFLSNPKEISVAPQATAAATVEQGLVGDDARATAVERAARFFQQLHIMAVAQQHIGSQQAAERSTGNQDSCHQRFRPLGRRFRPRGNSARSRRRKGRRETSGADRSTAPCARGSSHRACANALASRPGLQ